MGNKRPTQRTLEVLRKNGYTVGVVERWNSFVKVRQDLFGFIDIIAIKENEIIGIQCCTGSNHATHRKKILENEVAPLWLLAGAKIEIRSWSRRKVKLKNGNTTDCWTERVENIA